MVVRVFWGYHHLRKHPYAILPYMGDEGNIKPAGTSRLERDIAVRESTGAICWSIPKVS